MSLSFQYPLVCHLKYLFKNNTYGLGLKLVYKTTPFPILLPSSSSWITSGSYESVFKFTVSSRVLSEITIFLLGGCRDHASRGWSPD